MSATLPKLQSALAQAKLELPEDQVQKLSDLLDLIVKWNKAYNLTAIRELDQMIPRHIIDSLTLLPYIKANASGGTDIIDIGSGAGLPVIPLAIVFPQLKFLSIESNGKKTRFQQQAKLELGLENLTVMQERVENVKAQAPCVVSRAFTAPDKFLTIANELCAPGGQVLIMLGKADKMPEQLQTPFTLQQVDVIEIADVDSERHIAVVNKA